MITTEEKAKAYDKALKVIKDNLDALNEIAETGAKIVNIQTIKNCFHRAFPELKENEDEKIKNQILYAIRQLPICEETKDKCIAWLEKQGEKTTDEEMIETFRTEYEKGRADVIAEIQTPAWSEKYIADVFEKVGLSKIVREQSNDNLTNALQDAMIELSNFLLQQNPAWNEENDNRLSTIIAEFSKCSGKSVSKDKRMCCNDWLNSLRDRVQPKQEWNEEDE